MKKILIVLGHNNYEKSTLNKGMINAVKNLSNVKIIDLYDRYNESKIGYMDKIKIKEDQQLMLDSDIIINQFPFHWYTSPPMTDNWREHSLEWNWAYGEKFKLENKITTVVFTAGEKSEDYSPNGRSIYKASEFIKRFEATARYCKMKWIPDFHILNAGRLSEKELSEKINEYKEWILKISK